MLTSGDTFATSSYKQGVSIFDTHPTPKLRHELDSGEVSWWNIAAIGDDLLVTASDSGWVVTWRASSGEVLDCYYLGQAKSEVLVSCHSLIVLAVEDGTFYLLKHKNGKNVHLFSTFRTTRDDAPYYLTSYGTVFAASARNSITVFDTQFKKCIARLPVPLGDIRACFHLDLNHRYLVGVREDTMYVYANQTDFPLQRIVSFPDTDATAVKLLCDDMVLVAGTANSTLSLVCLKTADVLQCIRLPFEQVNSILITADARIVVVAFGDEELAVFDAPRASILRKKLQKYAWQQYGSNKFNTKNCGNKLNHLPATNRSNPTAPVRRLSWVLAIAAITTQCVASLLR